MPDILVTVGRNPLPVAIATARLITKYEGATVTFIASKQESEFRVSEVERICRSVKLLTGKALATDCIELRDARNPRELWEKVHAWAVGRQMDIHFHYTGGTKPMGVETARALEKIRPGRVSLSYTAADEHCIKASIPSAMNSWPDLQTMSPRDERFEFGLTVSQLAELHGYTITYLCTTMSYNAAPGLTRAAPSGANPGQIPNPRSNPSKLWLELSAMIATAKEERLGKEKRLRNVPRREGGQPYGNPNWFELPSRANPPYLPWPVDLNQDFRVKMNEVLGVNAWVDGTFHEELLEDDAQLEFVWKWLGGGWLEDYAFGAFSKALDGVLKVDMCVGVRFAIEEFTDKGHKYRKGVKKDFELDLAVVLGFQLVAVSCCSSSDVKQGKPRGLEVMHRARQIGGGEATAVLITLLESEQAKNLGDELINEARTVNVPIRVWGRDDLMHLEQRVHELMNDLRFPTQAGTHA